MKSSFAFAFTIVSLIIIAAMLILPAFNPPGEDAGASMNAALQAQVTITPPGGDNSVIGSTDGIVVMGILIMLVSFVPLFFRRRKK